MMETVFADFFPVVALCAVMAFLLILLHNGFATA